MDARPAPPRLQFGGVTLVPDERLVLRDGQPVLMTPKAFDLLLVLAKNPGRLLTKDQLMQAVWADAAVEEANLSYHVFAIRKALGDTAENGLIATIPKRGYRFTAAVTAVPESEGHPLASGLATAAGDTPARPATARRGLRPAAWLGAGVMIGVGSMLLISLGRTDARGPVIRAQISPGVQLSQASPFALSPDGQKLVFAGSGPDGVTRLWLQRIGEGELRPLEGTESALPGLTPPMFCRPTARRSRSTRPASSKGST